MTNHIYIGLDIGGTKLMAAATDTSGRVLHRLKAPTPIDLNQGLAQLQQMVHEVAADGQIVAIGAAVGGPLDWQTGIVSPLHQPQWHKVPLKAIMEKAFDCPFFVDVDTNVAAMGEYQAAVSPPRSLLYLTVSTGMGGGFVINGRLYRGLGGAHPEIAHQAINGRCQYPERIQCACGLPDCLEALVSGNGIERIYQKPAQELTAAEWEEVAYNLGQGLRNVATIYLPDEIVLGGGVAVGGGERFISQAATVMRHHLKLVPHPQVRLSRLGYDTALMGAAYIARVGLTE